jgi:hypothetical protein
MKMKFTHYAIIFVSVMLFASCTKQAYYSDVNPEQEWIRTHEKGVVAYVDNYSGNYIVETYQGYSVVELRGGIVPRQYDNEYAWFSSKGTQSVYNYDGNYYTKETVVESFLNWSDALYVLDNISQ